MSSVCEGIFKIEDSSYVAKLWGLRKNRPAMNYDKLSRSIRQYYKKQIIKKTNQSKRLVYQFCPPYLWLVCLRSCFSISINWIFTWTSFSLIYVLDGKQLHSRLRWLHPALHISKSWPVYADPPIQSCRCIWPILLTVLFGYKLEID